MADNIIENSTDTQESNQLQVDAKTELAQQMQIALNGGRVPAEQITSQVAETVETITDATTTPIVAGSETTTTTTPSFTFDIFKEKYAYEKPEDIIKEIDEYRKFKENPIAEIEFENESSKKLFDAIKGGKQKEAYAILAEQETLENITSAPVTKDNVDDIIKLGMKYRYKDLSQSEIDYKFKKSFSIPKQPVQEASETDADFEIIMQEWKDKVADIEMDKIIEAKSLKPELESHKQKLILPDIESNVDEEYVNWKQLQESSSKTNAETIEAYKAFTPKSIETKLNFTDEASKVAFEFQYEPKADSFANSVDMVTDINKFYNKFIGQDGKPDRAGFLRAIHFATNADAILTEAMKQAKNATIKSSLPNNNGAIVRQLPQGQQMSELDESMKRAGVMR